MGRSLLVHEIVGAEWTVPSAPPLTIVATNNEPPQNGEHAVGASAAAPDPGVQPRLQRCAPEGAVQLFDVVETALWKAVETAHSHLGTKSSALSQIVARSANKILRRAWRAYARASVAVIFAEDVDAAGISGGPGSGATRVPRPLLHLPAMPAPIALSALEAAAAGVQDLLFLSSTSTRDYVDGDRDGARSGRRLFPIVIQPDIILRGLLRATPLPPVASGAVDVVPWCPFDAVVSAAVAVGCMIGSSLQSLSGDDSARAPLAQSIQDISIAVTLATLRAATREFADFARVRRRGASSTSTGGIAPLGLMRWLDAAPTPLDDLLDTHQIVSTLIESLILSAGLEPPLAAIAAAYALPTLRINANIESRGGNWSTPTAPSPHMSLHRLLTCIADTGLNRFFAQPLHVYAAAFATAVRAHRTLQVPLLRGSLGEAGPTLQRTLVLVSSAAALDILLRVLATLGGEPAVEAAIAVAGCGHGASAGHIFEAITCSVPAIDAFAYAVYDTLHKDAPHATLRVVAVIETALDAVRRRANATTGGSSTAAPDSTALPALRVDAPATTIAVGGSAVTLLAVAVAAPLVMASMQALASGLARSRVENILSTPRATLADEHRAASTAGFCPDAGGSSDCVHDVASNWPLPSLLDAGRDFTTAFHTLRTSDMAASITSAGAPVVDYVAGARNFYIALHQALLRPAVVGAIAVALVGVLHRCAGAQSHDISTSVNLLAQPSSPDVTDSSAPVSHKREHDAVVASDADSDNSTLHLSPRGKRRSGSPFAPDELVVALREHVDKMDAMPHTLKPLATNASRAVAHASNVDGDAAASQESLSPTVRLMAPTVNGSPPSFSPRVLIGGNHVYSLKAPMFPLDSSDTSRVTSLPTSTGMSSTANAVPSLLPVPSATHVPPTAAGFTTDVIGVLGIDRPRVRILAAPCGSDGTLPPLLTAADAIMAASDAAAGAIASVRRALALCGSAREAVAREAAVGVDALDTFVAAIGGSPATAVAARATGVRRGANPLTVGCEIAGELRMSASKENVKPTTLNATRTGIASHIVDPRIATAARSRAHQTDTIEIEQDIDRLFLGGSRPSPSASHSRIRGEHFYDNHDRRRRRSDSRSSSGSQKSLTPSGAQSQLAAAALSSRKLPRHRRHKIGGRTAAVSAISTATQRREPPVHRSAEVNSDAQTSHRTPANATSLAALASGSVRVTRATIRDIVLSPQVGSPKPSPQRSRGRRRRHLDHRSTGKIGGPTSVTAPLSDAHNKEHDAATPTGLDDMLAIAHSNTTQLLEWLSPQTALERLDAMLPAISAARVAVNSATSAAYVWEIPVDHPGWDDPLLEGSYAAMPSLCDGRLAFAFMNGASVEEVVVTADDDSVAACDRPRASMRVTSALGALRAAAAWAEFHLGVLAALEADVLVEALAWSDVAWDAASAVSTITAASPQQPGERPTREVIPPSLLVYAQMTQAGTIISVDSYARAAADADSVLAAAARHFERAAALRPGWQRVHSARTTVHTRRAMLTYPFVMTAAGEAAVTGTLTLPLPTPEGMLVHIAPDGSRLDVDCLRTSDTATMRSSSRSARDLQLGTTTLVQSIARRRASAFVHSSFNAQRLLRAARAAATASKAYTTHLKSDTTHAHISPAAGNDPLSLTAMVTVVRSMLLCNAALVLSSRHQQARAGGNDVASTALLPPPPPPPPLDSSLSDDAAHLIRIVSEGCCDAAAGSPAVWRSRLVFPTYMPSTFARYGCAFDIDDAGATAAGDIPPTVAAGDIPPTAAAGDGRIRAIGLTAVGAAVAYAAFTAFDRDGDGMLSGPELLAAWKACGWDASVVKDATVDLPLVGAQHDATMAIRVGAWVARRYSCSYLTTRSDSNVVIEPALQPAATIVHTTDKDSARAVNRSTGSNDFEANGDDSDAAPSGEIGVLGERVTGWDGGVCPRAAGGKLSLTAPEMSDNGAPAPVVSPLCVVVWHSSAAAVEQSPPRDSVDPRGASFGNGGPLATTDVSMSSERMNDSILTSGAYAPTAPLFMIPRASRSRRFTYKGYGYADALTGGFFYRAWLMYVAGSLPVSRRGHLHNEALGDSKVDAEAPMLRPPLPAFIATALHAKMNSMKHGKSQDPCMYAEHHCGESSPSRAVLARRIPTETRHPGLAYTAAAVSVGFPAFAEFFAAAATANPVHVAMMLFDLGILSPRDDAPERVDMAAERDVQGSTEDAATVIVHSTASSPDDDGSSDDDNRDGHGFTKLGKGNSTNSTDRMGTLPVPSIVRPEDVMSLMDVESASQQWVRSIDIVVVMNRSDGGTHTRVPFDATTATEFVVHNSGADAAIPSVAAAESTENETVTSSSSETSDEVSGGDASDSGVVISQSRNIVTQPVRRQTCVLVEQSSSGIPSAQHAGGDKSTTTDDIRRLHNAGSVNRLAELPSVAAPSRTNRASISWSLEGAHSRLGGARSNSSRSSIGAHSVVTKENRGSKAAPSVQPLLRSAGTRDGAVYKIHRSELPATYAPVAPGSDSSSSRGGRHRVAAVTATTAVAAVVVAGRSRGSSLHSSGSGSGPAHSLHVRSASGSQASAALPPMSARSTSAAIASGMTPSGSTVPPLSQLPRRTRDAVVEELVRRVGGTLPESPPPAVRLSGVVSGSPAIAASKTSTAAAVAATRVTAMGSHDVQRIDSSMAGSNTALITAAVNALSTTARDGIADAIEDDCVPTDAYFDYGDDDDEDDGRPLPPLPTGITGVGNMRSNSVNGGLLSSSLMPAAAPLVRKDGTLDSTALAHLVSRLLSPTSLRHSGSTLPSARQLHASSATPAVGLVPCSLGVAIDAVADAIPPPATSSNLAAAMRLHAAAELRRERLARDCAAAPHHRLFDYFAIIGRGEIDVNAMSDDRDEKGGPLDLEFIPQVSARLPTRDWDGAPLPDRVAQFAFPHGCRLAPSPSPPPSTLTFVLTYENGSCLYCSTLMRWERLRPSDIVAMFIEPAATFELHGGNSSGRDVGAAQRYKLVAPGWMHRLLLSPSQAWPELYSPTALLLASHAPIFPTMRATLRQLLRLASTSAGSARVLPLERYAQHLIGDIPLPPRGTASVGFTLADRHFVVARPPRNELPETDPAALQLLCQCLDVHSLIAAFTAALLERRVALCSRHAQLLTPAALALTSLLFPFKWSVSFIPLLPRGELLDLSCRRLLSASRSVFRSSATKSLSIPNTRPPPPYERSCIQRWMASSVRLHRISLGGLGLLTRRTRLALTSFLSTLMRAQSRHRCSRHYHSCQRLRRRSSRKHCEPLPTVMALARLQRRWGPHPPHCKAAAAQSDTRLPRSITLCLETVACLASLASVLVQVLVE